MKKFIVAAALVSVCFVSCKKETITPKKDTINNNIYMSGGGDKRPSSHAD